MKVNGTVLNIIGHTPIVEIKKLNSNPKVRIFAKLEGFNPSGSVKDRMAKYMIEDAEKKGILNSEKVLLEPTSGNTGASFAMVSAVKGYKFMAVMPENASVVKRSLVEAYGGKVVFSPAKEWTNGSRELAIRLVEEDKKFLMLDQLSNPANSQAHYETTGEEIIREIPRVDVFIAGVGTGGTITGVGKRLKDHNPKVKIVAIEPRLGEIIPGLRNMKQKFVPPVFNQKIVDETIEVSAKDALAMKARLSLKEGISGGISSGAAMVGGLEVAERLRQGTIVILFPDRGSRYVEIDSQKETSS